MDKPLSTFQRRVARPTWTPPWSSTLPPPHAGRRRCSPAWPQHTAHPLRGLIEAGTAVPTVSCKPTTTRRCSWIDWTRLDLYCNHVGTTSFSVRCDMTRLGDERLCVRTVSWPDGARMSGGGQISPQPLPEWLRAVLGAAVHVGQVQ